MLPIKTLAAVAAIAAALAPGIAHADDPLISDTAGDATPLAVCVTWAEQGIDTCGARPLSDPTLDIVSGDLDTTGSKLVWSTTLLDLDDTAGRTYGMSARSGGADLGVRLAADGTALVEVYKMHVGYASAPADVVVDTATDTVTWSVPLATLDALRAQACPACAPIGRGSVLGDVAASTSDGRWGDGATAGRTYTIGG
ncbi:MAG TPA: hypothetical protein VM938_07670 [Acidimicrobiales bacterium]|nr:hypothetical protein [Acidimicrobiales bacterium]